MIEAGLALGLLERFFHVPARPGGPGQIDQPRPRRAVGDVVGDLGWVTDAAARQQPVPAPGCLGALDLSSGPVVFAGSVSSGTD